MKHLYTFFMLFITVSLFAQAPQGFNYQAVVRDSEGNLVINQNVYFRFNIMRNTPTSLPVYSETHYGPTDDLGTISLVIGQGTPTTGVFSQISWGEGTYYLGIELNTGNGYIAMGTTQFLSVPYALYANSAGNTEPQNLHQVLEQGNNAGMMKIVDLADPFAPHDAVNKAYVTLRVSETGDTLWFGHAQWVIIPGISQANSGGGGYTGTVTDIDGNVYQTVLIGNFEWMASNLKVTHYRNGESIPYPGDNNENWSTSINGAYAWYNNNMEWKDIYGGLYNFYAVVNQQGLCPQGWHVPTTEDWNYLEEAIGGLEAPNGDELKSCRQIDAPLEDCHVSIHPRWDYSEHHGTNDHGFNALPGGMRGVDGPYYVMGQQAFFWTSSEIGSGRAWSRKLIYNEGGLFVDDGYMKAGISVRCVKNSN
ncbi:MAG TPA: fibrobacter succinogenes major paralogous domain-containing protein [Lentimicrobium sp.]|nr:fibrobacter succinogenes major paralogous domain-containing protein [Lentimicrobium sp.]